MSWNGSKIKNLRRRLGWSQSDLGRRLHCDPEEINSWELGEKNPPSHQQRLLELFSQQLDPSSNEMKSHAIADSVLDQEELTQVSRSEIEGRLHRESDK